MPEILITIQPDGSTQVSVVGQPGPGCLDLTRAIEEALGETESRSCTLEYYEAGTEGEEVKQWGS